MGPHSQPSVSLIPPPALAGLPSFFHSGRKRRSREEPVQQSLRQGTRSRTGMHMPILGRELETKSLVRGNRALQKLSHACAFQTRSGNSSHLSAPYVNGFTDKPNVISVQKFGVVRCGTNYLVLRRLTRRLRQRRAMLGGAKAWSSNSACSRLWTLVEPGAVDALSGRPA
jgi:hypothetical protein